MNEQESQKLKAVASMEPCWIVWEAAADGGRPYLVAIDTSEEQAHLHVRAKKDEARVHDRPPPMLRIEESWLDHLYGESMTKSFDEAKKMAREVQRAQIADLRTHLRRAVQLAREAWNDLDKNDADEVAELDALEKILPPLEDPHGSHPPEGPKAPGGEGCDALGHSWRIHRAGSGDESVSCARCMQCLSIERMLAAFVKVNGGKDRP